MALLFSVVARSSVVLARHADVVGNFAQVTDQLLAKIESAQDLRRSLSHGKFLYHYLCTNGLVFLCIAG
jgi:vesicle-associated membrane protein 7